MVQEKTWDEFRKAGLLWWINMILHTFGWAIAVDVDADDKVVRAFPARVKFRGFDDNNNSAGYIAVSKYLKENAGILEEESKE
jgi:hypothetical protein